MSFFITEKQTEDWLIYETRDLPMPDGSFRPVTDFKLGWELYDLLLSISDYTPERLVGFALEESQLSGLPFEKTFPSCVAYLDRHLRDSLIDEQIAYMKERMRLQKGKVKAAFNQANRKSPF